MKLSIQAGATSQTINVFIADSSSSTGAGLTGLVYNSAGLTAYYALPRAAAVSITLATLAAVTSSYSSGGFKEIDATNMPGWYRFDVPDAALASGRFVSLHLKGATNMAPLPIEIELTGWNNQDAVRGGMTALPNANAGANGGLPLSVDSSGRVDVLKINGTSQTARDIGASVLISSGTGTGQLDVTSGVVKANLVQILATALTETAGQIAAGFKKFFNVATPTGTVNSLPDAVPGAANALHINGTNAGSLVYTNGMSLPGGLLIAPSAGNVDAVLIQGHGNGYGLRIVGGANSAKPAVSIEAQASTGPGVEIIGGPSGDGVNITVGSGNARGVYIAGGGSGAGLSIAGGATGDGIVAVGNGGGVDIRADITGDIDGTVNSVDNIAAQTGDSYARLGAPAGASVSADIAALPTVAENADGLLARSLATGADGGRTVQDALRTLRNKVDTSVGGVVTVYQEDDTTAAWTGTLTTSASADPIVTVDPS